MKKRFKLIIAILMVSFIISLWIYQFNIKPDIRDANKQHIVFERLQPAEGETVKINRIFPEGFSFFLDLKTKITQGNSHPHILMEQIEEKVKFILTVYGDLSMSWKSEKAYDSKNTITFFPTSFKHNNWNQVGFVYRVAYPKDILATYINGKLLWEKNIPRKNPLVGCITLFPSKLGSKEEGFFIEQGKNVLLLDRALSCREVHQYYLNNKINAETKGLDLKIIIIFLIFNALFHFFFIFYENILNLQKKGQIKSIREDIFKLGFLLTLNILCFLIFNLGNTAARYLHSIPQFSGEGIYLFILNLLFFVVLFTFFLEIATKREIGQCISLSSAILLLLAFNWILCALPRFEDFSPFCFNILFALLFTLIAGSLDILKMLEKKGTV